MSALWWGAAFGTLLAQAQGFKKLLALYGLKWNPFAPDVPAEALQLSPRIDSFCWRVEQLADFYREMGELFGVELHPHNRYNGAKLLRARWQAHIDRRSFGAGRRMRRGTGGWRTYPARP